MATTRSLVLCVLVACALVLSSPTVSLAGASLAGAPRRPFLIPERSVAAVAVRPDGNVVIAGRTGDRLAASQAPRPCRRCRVYLAEFDRSGQLVPGFGGEWPGRWLGGVRAIALGPGGDIYLAGKSNGGARIAHFDPEGRIDLGFGGTGVVKFQEVGDRILPDFEALAIEPDGTVVAAGTVRTVDGWSEGLLLRFEPDGSLDGSFGTGGVVLTGASPGRRLGPKDVEAVALMEDGRIVVAGSTEHLYKQRSALFARYLPDGGLDPSFGTRGQRAVGATHTGNLSVESVGVLGDGGVVIAGENFFALPGTVDMCRTPLVARLLPDGTPELGFGGSSGQEPGVLDAGRRLGSPCGNEAATVLGDGSTAFTLFDREESSIFPGRLAPDGSRAPGFGRPSSTALTPPRSGFLWHFRRAPGGEVEAGEVAAPFPPGSHGPFYTHSVLIVARQADGTLRGSFGDRGTVIFPP